jgi:hypothetical protein
LPHITPGTKQRIFKHLSVEDALGCKRSLEHLMSVMVILPINSMTLGGNRVDNNLAVTHRRSKTMACPKEFAM